MAVAGQSVAERHNAVYEPLCAHVRELNLKHLELLQDKACPFGEGKCT